MGRLDEQEYEDGPQSHREHEAGLVSAILANDLPKAAQLIAKLPDINFRLEHFKFKTALQIAVDSENVQAVLLLLSTRRAFLSRVEANAQDFLNNLARLRFNPLDKTEFIFLTHNDRGFITTRGGNARAECSVSTPGAWYYEVEMRTTGGLQLGWSTAESIWEDWTGEGVGDDEYSYGYDGCRVLAFHKRGSTHYGRKWNRGDVIGCCVDLLNSTISYTLNGESLGVAFSDVDTTKALYPAVTSSNFQAQTYNFGTLPFKYGPPPGYRSIRDHYDTPVLENELHVTLRLGNLELLHLLMQQIPPDDGLLLDTNSIGSNILHYAVARRDGMMVKYLCDRMTKQVLLLLLTGHDLDGTPFHKAIVYGNLPGLALLVQMIEPTEIFGFFFDVRTRGGESCFELATRLQQVEIMHYLLTFVEKYVSEEEIHNRIDYALHIATCHGAVDSVKYLVEVGANVNHVVLEDYNRNFLHTAAIYGHVLLFRKFLEEYHIHPQCAVAPDGNFCSALHYAAITGNLELVKYLCELKVNVNAKDDNEDTPLHYAAANNFPEVIKMLIIYGADVHARNLNNETPYFFARVSCFSEVLTTFFQAGIHVNEDSSDGWTALHDIAGFGYVDLIDLMVHHKAVVDAVDQLDLETPLHVAAKNSFPMCVKRLIQLGANTRATNKDGLTPLHFAALTGHLPTIEVLLHGDPTIVNAVDHKSNKPLDLAIKGGHVKAIHALIEFQAESNHLDYFHSLLVWEHLRPKVTRGTPSNSVNWKTATVVGSKLYVFGQTGAGSGEERTVLHSLDVETRHWEAGWSYINLDAGAAHASVTTRVDNKIWVLSDPYSIAHCLDLESMTVAQRRCTGNVPLHGELHFVFTVNKYIYLHDTHDPLDGSAPYRTLFRLDTTSLTWTRLLDRQYHQPILDVIARSNTACVGEVLYFIPMTPDDEMPSYNLHPGAAAAAAAAPAPADNTMQVDDPMEEDSMAGLPVQTATSPGEEMTFIYAFHTEKREDAKRWQRIRVRKDAAIQQVLSVVTPTVTIGTDIYFISLMNAGYECIILDTEKAAWKRPTTCGKVPSKRWGFSLVPLVVGPKILLLGGRNKLEQLKDIYILHVGNSFAMAEDFRFALQSPYFSDLKIVLPNESIYAHRVILYARSRPFREYLAQNPTITEFAITMDPQLFKILLYFIYTDTLPQIPPGIEYHLLKAAKELIPEKVERLIQCLTNDTTASTMNQNFSMLKLHQTTGVCPVPYDIAFKCIGGIVYTNRIIVAARCPTLRAMLLSGMRETYQAQIDLDMPYEVCVKVNEFFYDDTGLVVNNGELLIGIFKAAQFLNLDRLKSYCENTIQECVEVENVAQLFQLADTYKATDLRAFCFYFMLQNLDAVKKTEGFLHLGPELQTEVIQKFRWSKRGASGDDLRSLTASN